MSAECLADFILESGLSMFNACLSSSKERNSLVDASAMMWMKDESTARYLQYSPVRLLE